MSFTKCLVVRFIELSMVYDQAVHDTAPLGPMSGLERFGLSMQNSCPCWGLVLSLVSDALWGDARRKLQEMASIKIGDVGDLP